MYAGQGIGYARSTEAELRFITDVSMTTGILLDPVYSGKALYYFTKLLSERPDIVQPGESVLFLHTGGVLGMYEKKNQLAPILPADAVQRMQVL